MNRPVFHVAFPVRDIDSTVEFYRGKLDLRIDFFGHQAVAHVSENDVPKRVSLYPRHFGVILEDEEEFDAFHARVEKSGIVFFERMYRRFEGTPREHKTFFLKDPSNNLIEFKWYKNPDLVFKSHPDSPPLRG